MANQDLVEIWEYAWIEVNCWGTVAQCKVYLVDGNAGYDILLSRNWMKRVGCVHDHGEDHVSIQGKDGMRITISGKLPGESEIGLLPTARVDDERRQRMLEAVDKIKKKNVYRNLEDLEDQETIQTIDRVIREMDEAAAIEEGNLSSNSTSDVSEEVVEQGPSDGSWGESTDDESESEFDFETEEESTSESEESQEGSQSGKD